MKKKKIQNQRFKENKKNPKKINSHTLFGKGRIFSIFLSLSLSLFLSSMLRYNNSTRGKFFLHPPKFLLSVMIFLYLLFFLYFKIWLSSFFSLSIFYSNKLCCCLHTQEATVPSIHPSIHATHYTI